MPKLFNTRRDLNAKQKLNIVYSAYGSLNDFQHQVTRQCQIARDLKFQPMTVSRVIRRL
jgi:Mn-dependent DtxR family transcriptional regulator